MTTLTKDSPGITVTLTCEPEDVSPYGNVQATEDDAADNLAAARVVEELNQGNQWAWCCVHVVVSYKGILKADRYLGCCSYESEAAFRSDGYFDDLVSECISDLDDQIKMLAA